MVKYGTYTQTTTKGKHMPRNNTVRNTILALALAALAPASQAGVIFDMTKYCSAAKKKSSTAASALKIINVENGVVQLLVVGYPSSLSVTYDGVSVVNYKVRENDFKCANKNYGTITYYNLNLTKRSSGTFKVVADNVSLEAEIDI